VAVRMGERADTKNHFCASRREGNQIASEASLHAWVGEPNKPLSHLASLARAGLSMACEQVVAIRKPNARLGAFRRPTWQGAARLGSAK
jgi:hypothetical protein